VLATFFSLHLHWIWYRWKHTFSARWCNNPYCTNPGLLISRNGDIRLPDFTTPTFFLWGYLKAKVFENNPPRNIVDLKERIRFEINNITLETLHNVIGSFAIRLLQCIADQERYLTDTIFKKWSFYVYNKNLLMYFFFVWQKIKLMFFSIFVYFFQIVGFDCRTLYFNLGKEFIDVFI